MNCGEIYQQLFICEWCSRPERSNMLRLSETPWTVIYGSVVNVLMDWAYGTYPSQLWNTLHGVERLSGSCIVLHNTLVLLEVYSINTWPNVSLW